MLSCRRLWDIKREDVQYWEKLFGKFLQQYPFPVRLLGLLTFIGTEGALRRPMNYDNQPSHPSTKSSRAKQALDRSELTFNVLRYTYIHGDALHAPRCSKMH